MAQFIDANTIINRAAVEVGIPSTTDPVSSQADDYVQLTGLLNAAGQELVELNPWQNLVSIFTLTTADEDSGTYSLPGDFAYMTDQTGWNQSTLFPVAGPLSAQQWSFLISRAPISNTIQSAYRLIDNSFELFPRPPASGQTIYFEYISRNWVVTAGASPVRQDTVISGTDIVLYDPLLIIKFLKLKWLQAKNLPANDAAMDFDRLFNGRIGKDTGASVLSTSITRGFPYLNYNSIPFTGYGL
jgi:hypothetical protein